MPILSVQSNEEREEELLLPAYSPGKGAVDGFVGRELRLERYPNALPYDADAAEDLQLTGRLPESVSAVYPSTSVSVHAIESLYLSTYCAPRYCVWLASCRTLRHLQLGVRASMSLPSMVHRSGDSLIVRSVVSGDALFGSVVEDVDYSDELLDSGDDKDLPECKIKRNYSCASCDYFTQNPRHFLYHLRDVHKEKVRIYECPSCLYASKHFQKLLRHTKMVHGSMEGVEVPDFARSKTRKRKSPEEPETPDDSRDADECEEEPEPDKSLYKCSLCSFTARNQPQLGKHEREEHIKTKFFRCTKCTYVTHMKARFTKHVKYHSMPMIKCDSCDFRTPYKWNLDRHCKNHNGRGAFHCSACNFTADIKQSLTVHEMNHHVPPVGQAAGLGVGRRRNKVGASDSTAAEEAAQVSQADVSAPVATDDNKKPAESKLKIPSKKLKSANNQQPGGRSYGSDFIHPDDIIHHANGNIYIKNKCKLCNFKSAWDGEMAKHEQKVHNITRNDTKPAKKPPRPVPNLIPLPTQTSVIRLPVRPEKAVLEPPTSKSSEPIMSQKDMNDICAKSANSALRDFASLFGSEDVFNHDEKLPDLLPTSSYSSTPNPEEPSTTFKKKNASFFDKLKEKLMTGAGESCNLTCQYCGHESKCLSELSGHQKTCGKQQTQAQNFMPVHNISSTRCQHCRQRCKSSTDLYNHLQICPEAARFVNSQGDDEDDMELKEIDISIEENPLQQVVETKPHPMENRVFVWNNIEAPMDIEIDEAPYDFADDKQEDNISLDLSVRTHSPGSESSYLGPELSLVNNNTVVEKIPTHGNDINIAHVAQHKRVFKCPHCSFWASTASRFHVHIVGHLNKKPFECSLCAYRSNWRWDITKHIKLKSVRDPAHSRAKVLMTDETGRRNYTKYNKYLTEIHVTGDHNETSGGAGTRPRSNNHDHHDNVSPSHGSNKTELPKLTRAPSISDFSPLMRTSPLRPPPPLKAADESFFAKLSSEKKRTSVENKKTLWKCKKCNFRDASHEKLLVHVKGHYQQEGGIHMGGHSGTSLGVQSLDNDEASENRLLSRGHAPFRCGHCHQVSNWKHVIQRHCRLKHSGDIRVVIGSKTGPEKLEIDEQVDEPDHIDLPQTGTFKCKQCPFSNDDHDGFELHLNGHLPRANSIMKCYYCTYFVSEKEELHDHLKLHGIADPEEFMSKMLEKNANDPECGKRYRCAICPYVTNSKSQFLYHKQFHKPRGGQYTCSHCSYNVSKRHLLHQHLKVHGINITPHKQNGEVIDLDELPDEGAEFSLGPTNFESQNFLDIPLVWVSKTGKFSKMFKCRFCPHVNLRKVNIQEHEKMHGVREKNSSKVNEIEHRCVECNYVCNNAGVLSSHSKVHQGLYGQIHCLVDATKSDDEQIRELSRFINLQNQGELETIDVDGECSEIESGLIESADEQAEIVKGLLYFCDRCPARFLKENEFDIHCRFHGLRLFYKCEFCTYTSRQKPHLLAHNKVHTFEYQEKTKALQKTYETSLEHLPPQTVVINQHGELLWVAIEPPNSRPFLDESDIEAAPVIKQKTSMNVPISGTELFQQKSEAIQKQAAAEKIIVRPNEHFPPTPFPVDPQFGTLMHGNPKFIYPTYLKNGRMKEKRYKCHKCPSAFEKREQYKVHLTLHGAKQRYRCDHCDYSVKYYANYVQHLKKHQMNADAQAARKSGDFSEDTELDGEENEDAELIIPLKAAKSIAKQGPLKLTIADRQALMVLNQRRGSSNSSNKDSPVEEKKLFWCPSCPYTNYRKDAVDNHQKRHVSVSGFTSNYTCDHCDYSVPQVHFLREHTKLHFLPNKINQLDAYMSCDNLKISCKKIVEETDIEGKSPPAECDEPDVIFVDNGTLDEENRFLPIVSNTTLLRFNNNVGEKNFVNPETGEMVDKNKANGGSLPKEEVDEVEDCCVIKSDDEASPSVVSDI